MSPSRVCSTFRNSSRPSNFAPLRCTALANASTHSPAQTKIFTSAHFWHLETRFAPRIICCMSSSLVHDLLVHCNFFCCVYLSCWPILRFSSSRLTLSNSRFNIRDVTDHTSLGFNMHTTGKVSLLPSRDIVTFFAAVWLCGKNPVLIQHGLVSISSKLRSTLKASSHVSCNRCCELDPWLFQ